MVSLSSRAYWCLSCLCSALIPVFNSSDGAYLVPLVKNLSSELVNLALIVDKTLGLQGKSQKVNNAARLLSKMFNMMLADRYVKHALWE